jgi:type IV secretion system protein VirB3
MADTGSLKVDPLFLGLTRIPMFFGVSFSLFILNMFSCLLYFINTSDFRVVLLGATGHGIGYWICLKEPLFIEIYMNKMQHFNVCKNKMFHMANSYDFR